ncbi:hypothetical protein BLNAU_8168 [Blattamonas nauphoetae]|uniref:Uncharacterized protein n=1 Tax=Blattamonas nauphoetae TaxID=2049346 RepID=A0ABQ9XZJ5_9EUKA|nr:hypothetical protein BLNAU_8168 [Blattamonas nauphoetae]
MDGRSEEESQTITFSDRQFRLAFHLLQHLYIYSNCDTSSRLLPLLDNTILLLKSNSEQNFLIAHRTILSLVHTNQLLRQSLLHDGYTSKILLSIKTAPDSRKAILESLMLTQSSTVLDGEKIRAAKRKEQIQKAQSESDEKMKQRQQRLDLLAKLKAENDEFEKRKLLQVQQKEKQIAVLKKKLDSLDNEIKSELAEKNEKYRLSYDRLVLSTAESFDNIPILVALLDAILMKPSIMDNSYDSHLFLSLLDIFCQFRDANKLNCSEICPQDTPLQKQYNTPIKKITRLFKENNVMRLCRNDLGKYLLDIMANQQKTELKIDLLTTLPNRNRVKQLLLLTPEKRNCGTPKMSLEEQVSQLSTTFNRFNANDGDMKELDSTLTSFRNSNNWEICLAVLQRLTDSEIFPLQQFCLTCLGQFVRLHWMTLLLKGDKQQDYIKILGFVHQILNSFSITLRGENPPDHPFIVPFCNFFNQSSPNDPTTGAPSMIVRLVFAALQTIRATLRLIVPFTLYKLPVNDAVLAALPFATMVFPSELRYLPPLPDSPVPTPQPISIDDLLLSSNPDSPYSISLLTLELVADLAKNTNVDLLFASFVCPLLEFAKQYAHILTEGFFSRFFYMIGAFCETQIKIDEQDPSMVNIIVNQFITRMVDLTAQFCGHLVPVGTTIFQSQSSPITATVPSVLPHLSITNTFSPREYKLVIECFDSIFSSLSDTKENYLSDTSSDDRTTLAYLHQFASVLLPLAQNSLTAPTFLANPTIITFLINNHLDGDDNTSKLSDIRLFPLFVPPREGTVGRDSLPRRLATSLPQSDTTLHNSIFDIKDKTPSNWISFSKASIDPLFSCLSLSPRVFFGQIESSITQLLNITGQKLSELHQLPTQAQSPLSLPFFVITQSDKTSMLDLFSTLCDCTYAFTLTDSLGIALHPLLAGQTQHEFDAPLPPTVDSPIDSPETFAMAAAQAHSTLFELLTTFARLFGDILSTMMRDLFGGQLSLNLLDVSSQVTPVRVLSTLVEAACQCMTALSTFAGSLIATRIAKVESVGQASFDAVGMVDRAVELSLSFISLGNQLQLPIQQASNADENTQQITEFSAHLLSPILSRSVSLLSSLIQIHRLPTLTSRQSFITTIQTPLSILFSIPNDATIPSLHPLFPFRHSMLNLSLTSLILHPRSSIFSNNSLSLEQRVNNIQSIIAPALVTFDVMSLLIGSSSLEVLSQAASAHLDWIRLETQKPNSNYQIVASYFSQFFADTPQPLSQSIEINLVDSLAVLVILSKIFYQQSGQLRQAVFDQIVSPQLGPLCGLFSFWFAQQSFFAELPSFAVVLSTVLGSVLSTFGEHIGSDIITSLLLFLAGSVGVTENGINDAAVKQIQANLLVDGETIPSLTQILLNTLDSPAYANSNNPDNPVSISLLSATLLLTSVYLDSCIQAQCEAVVTPNQKLHQWLSTTSRQCEGLVDAMSRVLERHFSRIPLPTLSRTLITILTLLNPIGAIPIHLIPPELSSSRPFPDSFFTEAQLPTPSRLSPPSSEIIDKSISLINNLIYGHRLYSNPIATDNQLWFNKFLVCTLLCMYLIDEFSPSRNKIRTLLSDIIMIFSEKDGLGLLSSELNNLWGFEVVPWCLLGLGDVDYLSSYIAKNTSGETPPFDLTAVSRSVMEGILGEILLTAKSFRTKRG